MKNIEEKIINTEEEIKQLQNKRKKLLSQQKQVERKKTDKRLIKKGGVSERNRIKNLSDILSKSLIHRHTSSIRIMERGFLYGDIPF